MGTIEAFYHGVTKKLPPAAEAFLDAGLRLLLRGQPRGALNGQERRREIFSGLLDTGLFGTVVETGTHRGSTTEFLARWRGIRVFSVEKIGRFHRYSRFRLRRFGNVRLFLEDTRTFLARLLGDPVFPKAGVLFYLDAHGGEEEELPLADEIRTIREHWRDSAIVIDDFRVPDDAGYGFGTYNRGEQLSVEYLRAHGLLDFEVFWPAARSEQETGSRRGCVVLATRGRVAARLDQLPALRRIPL